MKDTYPEIFNNSVYFDIGFVVTEWVFKLREYHVSKATEAGKARSVSVDVDRRDSHT